MIDQETKIKLLNELEKTGIISIACMKIGISRAIYYRWCEYDPKFRKKAKRAVRLGHESANDLVEHSVLSMATKDKNLGAAKFWLKNNSPKYRMDRSSEAHIHHSRQATQSELDAKKPTMEDVIDLAQKLATEMSADAVEEYKKSQQQKETAKFEQNEKDNQQSSDQNATPPTPAI